MLFKYKRPFHLDFTAPFINNTRHRKTTGVLGVLYKNRCFCVLYWHFFNPVCLGVIPTYSWLHAIFHEGLACIGRVRAGEEVSSGPSWGPGVGFRTSRRLPTRLTFPRYPPCFLSQFSSRTSDLSRGLFPFHLLPSGGTCLLTSYLLTIRRYGRLRLQ